MTESDKQSPSSREMFFEYVLRTTRGRIRVVDVVSAALLLLAIAGAMLLAVVICDHVIAGGLSYNARRAMRWLIVVAAAALAAGTIIWPLLRKINDLYIARMIERANPSFRNDLTAAVQLGRDEKVDAASLAAIRIHASQEVAGAAVGSAVNLHGLRLSALVLAGVSVAFGLYAAVAPKPVWDSLARAIGNNEIAAPTHTRIVSVSPADGAVVLIGTDVRFDAFIHQPTGPVVLKITRGRATEALDEDTLTMKAAHSDNRDRHYYQAVWRAMAPTGPAEFRIFCGDAKSRPRMLRVLPAPAIKSVRVRQDWPKYTSRGTVTEDGGSVEAPAGTVVTVLAKTNLPAVQASLIFEGSQRRLIMTPAGKELRATFRLTRSDRYHIRFTIRDIVAAGRSVWFDVRAITDMPPIVKVNAPSPGKDRRLPVNEAFRLAGEVTDDFGLAAVEMVCLHGGHKIVIPLRQARAPGAMSLPVEQQIPGRQLGRVGDIITCYLQARDCKPANPPGQIGRSKAFTIQLTAPDPQKLAQQQAEREAHTRAQQAQRPEEQATGQQAPQEPHADRAGEDLASAPPDEPGKVVADQLTQAEPPPRDEKLDANQLMEDLLRADRQDAEKLEILRQQLDQDNQAQEQQAQQAQDQQAQDQQAQAQQGQTQQGQPQQGQAQQGQQSQIAGRSGATTPHSRTAGGSGGSRDQQGQVDPIDPAVLRQSVETARLESIGRALKNAQKQIRDDKIDPALLKHLGMDPQQFRKFVKEYTGRYELARRQAEQRRKQRLEGAIEMVGSAKLQRNGETQLGDVTDSEKLKAEQDRQLRETRGRQVSPKYRKKLDAYFRAVSESENE